MVFQLYRICHLLVTGFIIILISIFFASGGVDASLTDNTYPYPYWLMAIPVWVIGALLAFNIKTVKLD